MTQYCGLTITVERDQDAEAPHNGELSLFLITNNNRYFAPKPPKGFGLAEVRDRATRQNYHILPLFAYIHSGVALSTSRDYPFNDHWDSGQIGYVMVQKRAGYRNIQKAAQGLVEEWNQYLRGDIWGYTITDQQGNHIDSLWGMYGYDYCQSEAMAAAKEHIETELKSAGDIPEVRP